MMTPGMSRADVGARLVERGMQIVGGGAVEAGQVDQRHVAAPLVGDGGRDDAAALHARARARAPCEARSTVSATGAPTAPRSLCTTSPSVRSIIDSPSIARIWSPACTPALADGRAVLHGADQDLLVVGALDGDADAAAAVALEAVVARLVGVGVAAVAVELLGGGRHAPRGSAPARSVCCRAGEASIERGEQLGQHAAPGAAVGRIGRASGGVSTSRPSRLTVKARVARSPATAPDRRWRSRGRSRPTCVRKSGSYEVAVADRAIGLQDDPLDADVGGGGRVARRAACGVVGRGRAGGDQGGGEEGRCRMRQRLT